MLAAGGSRRFKGAKLAATLPTSQKAIIFDSYAKLKQLSDRVNAEDKINLQLELLVILGGHHTLLQSILPDTAHYLVNTQWAQGLSTSVKCAAHYAQQQQASGLMITLADQVAIDVEDYQQLLLLWLQDKQTVASKYLNEPGVPAIFNDDDLADFSMINGDRGAKPVLMAHQAQNRLSLLPLDCAAWDIDTREELARWDQK